MYIQRSIYKEESDFSVDKFRFKKENKTYKKQVI